MGRISPAADHFWDYYENLDDHFWDYYSCRPADIKKWNDIQAPELPEACSTVEHEDDISELSFYLSYYHAASPRLDSEVDVPEVASSSTDVRVSKLEQVSSIVLQFLEPYLQKAAQLVSTV